MLGEEVELGGPERRHERDVEADQQRRSRPRRDDRALRGDRVVRDVRLAERQRVAAAARGTAHHDEIGEAGREPGIVVHGDADIGQRAERDERELARTFAREPREELGRGLVDRAAAARPVRPRSRARRHRG